MNFLEGFEYSTEEWKKFKRQQRAEGCTCRYWLVNGVSIERQINEEWDKCPQHGL